MSANHMGRTQQTDWSHRGGVPPRLDRMVIVKMLFRMLFVVMMLVTSASQSRAATNIQIDQARLKGVWWLMVHQNGDGGWKSASGTEVPTTAESLEALRNAGVKGFPYMMGVSWLSNADAYSVDSLARKATALYFAGLKVTPYLDQLVTWKNTSATWGAYDHFETSFPDTPLALSAIRIANYSYSGQSSDLTNALFCSILRAQKTGSDTTVAGSWSYINPGTTPPVSAVISGILPTTLNILEINAIKVAKGWTSGSCGSTTYYLQTAIDNGINWLLTQKRNADGGFGDNGVSTVLETVLVYQVLNTLRPTDPATGPALDYLLAQQNSTDGGWGDPFLTAMVLKNLPTTTLIDTDKDGAPDGVEFLMGTNPNVADSRWLAKGNGQSVTGVTAPFVLANAILNQDFSYTLTASGGTAPYTFSITSGSLPSGLSLNSATGVISGTPTSAGDYDFVYRVTDATLSSATVPGTITVLPLVTQDWAARYNGPANKNDSTRGGSKIAIDSAGNVYVTGSSSNGLNNDYATLKYDKDGNRLWEARYDNGWDDQPVALTVDSLGNVYVTGTSSNGANDDYATVKYDSNGNPLWGATGARYNNGGSDRAVALGVDSLGNVYVTGTSSNGANDDYATVKYDANGSPLWGTQGARYNNGGSDRAVALGVDSLGNVYVTGTSSSGVNDDYATVKYDSSGNPLWGATGTRYNNGGNDRAVALGVDSLGNVYVTGTSSNGVNDDYATVKYDSSGNPLWPLAARYDYGGNDRAVGMALDGFGNLYVIGSSFNGLSDDFATVKYDANGSQLWAIRYDSGYADNPVNLSINGSGEIYVTGSSCKENVTPDCRTDYTTLRYSSTGNQIWIAKYDSEGTTTPAGLVADDQGNAYVTGEVWNGTNNDYATIKYAVPPAPTNLRATDHPGDQGGAIDLTWIPYSNTKVTQQRIYRGTNPGGPYTRVITFTNNTTTTYTDTGLVNGTNYYYVVRAFDGTQESANSNEANAKPIDNLPPVVPTNLTATDHPADQGGAIDLSWTVSVSVDVKEQRIYRGTSSGVYGATPIVTFTNNTTNSYIDTGRVNGIRYYYVVRAFDGTQESTNSNEANAIPIDNRPAAPTGLTAADVSADQGGALQLNWTVSISLNVTQQRIYRGTSSGVYGAIPIVTFTNNTTNSYVDTGRVNGTTYYYVVRAFDGTQESANSNEASAMPVDNITPVAPTSLTAVDRPGDTGGAINLSWTPSTSTDVTQQRIYRGTSSGIYGSNPVATITNNTTNSYTDTGLINGTTYFYVIRAFDGTQESPNSNEGSAVPLYNASPNNWTTQAPMPTARRELAVGVVNGTLYAIGGRTGNASTGLGTVEAYDPATNTWTAKAPMPTPRSRLAIGVINGTLYAVGGRGTSGGALTTVEAYDPATDTWTTKAPMLTARDGLAVGVVNGILYAMGGYISTTSTLATVEAYNPSTNTWTTKASMPTGRYLFTTGVVNGLLYAVGGYNGGTILATVAAYNPSTNSWSSKASMPTARYDLAGGVINGLLYAVGGQNSSNGNLATNEAYNPATNSWTTKASMPTGRSALGAGVVNSLLYAVGGQNTSNGSTTVEAYTP